MFSSRAKLVALALLTLSLFLISSSARAATISLLPASGNVSVGQNLSVGVVVSTPDQPMNAVSGVLSYPADLLEVVSLSKSGSIVGLWVQEPAFSNTAGTVNFEGVVLNPGFTGTNGRVLGINFRAKRAGTATLAFLTPSVLANNGEGTNILTGAGSASYQLTAAAPIEIPITPRTPESDGLALVSSTHPNQESWYRSTTAHFQWQLPEGASAVRLLANSSRSSTPTVMYDPPITEREISDLPEGVSYFHAQALTSEGWTPAAHYRLQIDTTAPDHLVVSEVTRLDELDPRVKLKFNASDALSGIDHYEITAPGLTPALWRGGEDEVYETEALEPGTHTINVRAFDRAGNMLGSSVVVTVQAPPSEWYTWGQKALAAFSLAIPLLAVILVLGLMLQRSHTRFRAWRRKLRKEVHEAEESVGHAFDLIREDLEKQLSMLERAKTRRALTREENRILATVRKNLRTAEKYIKDQVEDIEKELK